MVIRRMVYFCYTNISRTTATAVIPNPLPLPNSLPFTAPFAQHAQHSQQRPPFRMAGTVVVGEHGRQNASVVSSGRLCTGTGESRAFQKPSSSTCPGAKLWMKQFFFGGSGRSGTI